MASPIKFSPGPGILDKGQDQITAYLHEFIDQNRKRYGLLYSGNRHNHVAHVREEVNHRIKNSVHR